MASDSISAYENHAQTFLKVRDRSTIGVGVIERWSRLLPANTDVLEIACGGGIPITCTLADAGLNLWAIDSSPTLIAAFKVRFPDIPVECASALDSGYFRRTFGAVVAIGLIFLLSADDQVALIHRVSTLLPPIGRFLFTAPIETGTWTDINTGHQCHSLGQQRYETILQEAQFCPLATYEDEGGNNYYDVARI